jgi:hypothetical protein
MGLLEKFRPGIKVKIIEPFLSILSFGAAPVPACPRWAVSGQNTWGYHDHR